MSGALPPVKISELPPYTGADNPDGTLPITIAGTTYGINTSKLGGSGGATPTLSQVIQQGDLLPSYESISKELTAVDLGKVLIPLSSDISYSLDNTLSYFKRGNSIFFNSNSSTAITNINLIPTDANSIVFGGIEYGTGASIPLMMGNFYRLFKSDGDDTTSGVWILTYEVGSISSGSSAVTSVNAQTGDVILNSDNIGDGTTYKQYSATEKTKLAGIASTYAPISTTPIILLNDNTTTSPVTGTTSNTILASYLIPANTFATGDRILIDFVGLKSTTTATGSFNINVNTTNSLFGATKIAGMTGGGAGNRFYVCQRSIAFKSSTSFEILSLSVNNTHDLGVDNNAPATITYDTTQAYYLIISVIPSNSADSFNQSRITVTKLKSKTTF